MILNHKMSDGFDGLLENRLVFVAGAPGGAPEEAPAPIELPGETIVGHVEGTPEDVEEAERAEGEKAEKDAAGQAEGLFRAVGVEQKPADEGSKPDTRMARITQTTHGALDLADLQEAARLVPKGPKSPKPAPDQSLTGRPTVRVAAGPAPTVVEDRPAGPADQLAMRDGGNSGSGVDQIGSGNGTIDTGGNVPEGAPVTERSVGEAAAQAVSDAVAEAAPPDPSDVADRIMDDPLMVQMNGTSKNWRENNAEFARVTGLEGQSDDYVQAVIQQLQTKLGFTGKLADGKWGELTGGVWGIKTMFGPSRAASEAQMASAKAAKEDEAVA